MALTQVSTGGIKDGTISNADLDASAAIDGSKVSPDFGSQNITTTGTVTGASLVPSSSTVPTNGVYLSAANSVALSTSGTGRLFVDANGNVGIGSSNPLNPLQIERNGNFTTAAIISNTDAGASASANIILYSNSKFVSLSAYAANNQCQIAGYSGIDKFYSDFDTHIWRNNAGATERARIDSSGRLLVGTASSSGNYLLEVNGAVKDSAGPVRSVPQNSQTSGYTLVASDTGKHISITTGGVTVPASVFSVGDVISIYNNSGSNQTITQGSSTTLRQAGTANTGNRTLAQYGVATVLCVASNTFVISGAGLS